MKRSVRTSWMEEEAPLLPYRPDRSYLSDPQIKDRHLAQALREEQFTEWTEGVFKRAAIIAAKETQ